MIRDYGSPSLLAESARIRADLQARGLCAAGMSRRLEMGSLVKIGSLLDAIFLADRPRGHALSNLFTEVLRSFGADVDGAGTGGTGPRADAHPVAAIGDRYLELLSAIAAELDDVRIVFLHDFPLLVDAMEPIAPFAAYGEMLAGGAA